MYRPIVRKKMGKEKLGFLLTKENCKSVLAAYPPDPLVEINDELIGEYFDRYKKCWKTWSSKINPNTLFQRYLHKPFEKTIPLFEITKLFRKPTLGRVEVLFVNCNPSGTDVRYYQKRNATGDDFFYYDNPKNTYFKSVENFYNELKLSDGNYAMIDLFPIVVKEQAGLEKAYYAYPAFFSSLLDIFVDAVVELQPKVIVVTNAFVRELFKKEMSKYFCFNENNFGVFYEIDNHRLNTAVFCGGMIAGPHQMDVESRKRLIRDIRCYLSFTA